MVADCDLPQLRRDLASSRTCCRMQLRAATKPTNANFAQVIRKKVQSIKVVTNDSIGAFSSGLYSLLFETSGTAKNAVLLVNHVGSFLHMVFC